MHKQRHFYQQKRFLIPSGILVLIACLVLWYVFATAVSPPTIDNTQSLEWRVTEPDSGLYLCGGNWFKQSNTGLWELFVRGAPFDRGVANGKLTQRLILKQEEAFIGQIRRMIPSESYLKFLKYFIYWFNRDLDRYLMPEYKEEIYGISFAADPRFNFIGTPYQRLLNYHSAHDIGHALQDLMLVGCTSFGVWDEFSADSSLIIGRNFDFYMGDSFAEDKIVCFELPDHGFGFVMVTWGGMVGTVSGMNEKGITVTINAARSDVPLAARTPISILAREILQYASSIDDAYRIACERGTFVSESLLIGSGDENKAALIEKTPSAIALVEPAKNYLVCSNHFQDTTFRDDELNQRNIRESASLYRYRRVLQLITNLEPADIMDAAIVLRDQKGLNGADMGMGNEKAINQLIAHHSILFKPGERKVWISTSPWQLGSYACYDLKKIFSTFATLQQRVEITEPDLGIPADPFLDSEDYQQFLLFRQMRLVLMDLLAKEEIQPLNDTFFTDFQATNPHFYEVYSLSGDYLLRMGKREEALGMYQKALSCEIPRWEEKSRIIHRMIVCKDY